MAKLGMGQLEAQVLDVLWDREAWLTPGEVHAVLTERRDLAYTTVMTILARLWQKGLLERRRDGRAYAYHPVVSREERAASRMADLMAAARGSSAVLSHFVQTLTPEERAQLRRVLKSG